MEIGAIIKHNIQKAPRTGNWKYVKPEVDEEKCVGCGTCVKFCPEACINLEHGTHIANRISQNVNPELRSMIHDPRCANIDYEWCKGCGVCAEACSVKAISMKKN